MMIMGLSLSCPGDGRQPLPWIHIDDIIEMYVQAIEHEKFSGIYNAVGECLRQSKLIHYD